MIAFITSNGRYDLLRQTIESLRRKQIYKPLKIFINEDSNYENRVLHELQVGGFINNTAGIGQHASIEQFLSMAPDHKYCLMLEDDWEFDNSYDWIGDSIRIMESDPNIIKVLARKDMIHPVTHDHEIIDMPEISYGILQPWQDPWHHTLWYGFSWNPGVTRLDYLRKINPFGRWEQDVAKQIHDAGYVVASLKRGIYTHIGEGRSTHE